MKIAITGSTGLIGSRLVEFFKGEHELIEINYSQGIDITDRSSVWEKLNTNNPSLILHIAAKTNVDLCEEDRVGDIETLSSQGNYSGERIDWRQLDPQAWAGKTSAFAVNSLGTKNLSDWAKQNNVRMIYVSTDFIFDGNKDSEYVEEDIPSPVNWYGTTKFFGEETLGENSFIARISYPYGHKSKARNDFVWGLATLIASAEHVDLVYDQIITPTFIDDIVRGLDFLIEKGTLGIVNLVGNDFLSPYQIGISLAQEFNLDRSKIGTISMEEFYKNRAKRPFKVRLRNDKLKHLGFEMTEFDDALKQILEKR